VTSGVTSAGGIFGLEKRGGSSDTQSPENSRVSIGFDT
jgi:hypothetical protein